jgi:hypothetical protein
MAVESQAELIKGSWLWIKPEEIAAQIESKLLQLVYKTSAKLFCEKNKHKMDIKQLPCIKEIFQARY